MVSCTRGNTYSTYLKVVDGSVSTDPCPFTMIFGTSCGNPACTPGELTDSVICAMGGPRTGDKVRCKPPAVVVASLPAPAPAPVAVVAEVLPASLVVTINADQNPTVDRNSVVGKCHGSYTRLLVNAFYTKTVSSSVVTIQPDAHVSGKIETMVIKFENDSSGITLKRKTSGTATNVTFDVMRGTTQIGTAVVSGASVQAATTSDTFTMFTIAGITVEVLKTLSEKGTGLVSTDAGVYTKSSTDNMYYLGNNPTTSLSRIKVSTTSGVSYDVQKRANTTSAFATKIGLIPSAGSATAFTGRIPAKTRTSAGNQTSTPSLIVPGFTAVLGAANAPPAPAPVSVVIPAPPAPAPVAVVAAVSVVAPVAAPDVTVDVKMYLDYISHDLHGQFAKVNPGDALYTKKSPVANQSLFLKPVNGGYDIIMKAQNGDLYTVSDYQVQRLSSILLVMVYLPRNMGVGLVSVLQAASVVAPPIQPVANTATQPGPNTAADTRCSVNKSAYPGYMLGTCPEKLALEGTCDITCNSVTKTLTCGTNNALTPALVACPVANVNPVPPVQNKCDSKAFGWFKLMDGEKLSNVVCPTEMVAGQSCASDCNTATQKRTRVTCEAGKPLAGVMLADPVCNVPVPDTAKRCTVNLPGYMLVGGGTCQPTIGIGQSCELPCTAAGGYKMTVTCNESGVLSAPTRVECPAGPVNPPSAQEAKCTRTDAAYHGYMLLSSTGTLIMGSDCPSQMSIGESCAKNACDANNKRARIKCVAGSTPSVPPTVSQDGDLTCIPPFTAPLTCTRDDKYITFKKHDGFELLLPPNPEPCPAQMDLGTYCSAPACPGGTSGRKSIKCDDNGAGAAVTESLVACTQTCARPSWYTANDYTYITGGSTGSTVDACPDRMAKDSLCKQKECGTSGKRTATCTYGTIDGEIKDEPTDQAFCNAPSTCSTADLRYANYRLVGAVGGDPTAKCPPQMTIGEKCADLTCPATGNPSTIKCEKATSAREAALTPNVADDQVRCTPPVLPTPAVELAWQQFQSTQATNQANIGGALPSASDTTLCAELIGTLPGVGVVCATTGVSRFVSINRGTFQVSVSVYRQLGGSWVGYGAQGAPGAQGTTGVSSAPPWKGVYVTIKPSASRSVPHSVTCVWHYPQPSQTTTVSYTAGVPSTSGAHFQYQLSPTTLQEAAFLSVATSVTMFNGNLFPLWPAEATMATATNAPVSSSGGLSTGAIVGIVLGIVALIALIVGLVFANRRSARVSDYYPPVPYNDRGA
jgi:hypothetical protein